MAQQNYFKHIGLPEGLPQSQVFDILQDSRGFIWAGTRGGGLGRYDGKEFQILNTKDGLINNFINCLLEDSKGNILIGTKSGLSIYNGIRFENHLLSSAGDVRVVSLLEVNDKLLIGTSDGLYVKQDSTITKIKNQDDQPNFYVTCLHGFENKIFMGTNRGLYAFENTNFIEPKYYTTRDGLADNYIQALTSDSNSLWIGTYGKGVSTFTDGKINTLAIPLPKNTVCYDLLRSENSLWIASQSNGVFQVKLSDEVVERYSTLNGLTNNHVRCILQDSWGNMWFGTSGGGLNQFAGQPFNHLTEKDGLPNNYIYSIYADDSGAIWSGTGSKGVVKHDSNKFTSYGLDSGFQHVKIKAICATEDGRIWFGSEGKGLGYMDTTGVHWLTTKQGLCGNYIKDLTTDKNGDLWVATLDGGISVLSKAKSRYQIKNYRYLTELPSNRIHALYADPESSIVWFGTESKGLGKIVNGRAETVITEADLNYHNIRAVRGNANGIWLATSGGLYRYDTKSKELITMQVEGLTSSNLYLLEFDHLGHLYLGHERGLEKLTLNETGDVIEMESFGAEDGFSGIETCQNASICDNNGTMWFGTVNGLTQYNPNNITTSEVAPRIWLDNIDLFYEKLQPNTYGYSPSSWNNLSTTPSFPHNQNHLTFSFTGIDLNNPTKLRYQWKLRGFDEEWRKPTDKRDAVYSNLPPGEYLLQYKSVSSAGISSAIHEWPFVIEAPFWQMWWFKLATWVIPILLILILVIGYIRRIKIREKRQREKLMVEKDLIELEQKALRLQMNPHFLFNALNSIQSLVALEQHQEARKYLQKFAKLMRLTLQNSRVDTIPLSDEIATLQNYIELEQFSKKAPFTYRIDIDETIQPDNVYIPPMMLQPFIENAIKHGLPERNEKGELVVSFTQTDNQLICRIRDNGIGREAAMIKAKEKSKSHESAAIQVITDRLNILNKEHEGNNLTITDLEVGTEVTITFAY